MVIIAPVAVVAAIHAAIADREGKRDDSAAAAVVAVRYLTELEGAEWKLFGRMREELRIAEKR